MPPGLLHPSADGAGAQRAGSSRASPEPCRPSVRATRRRSAVAARRANPRAASAPPRDELQRRFGVALHERSVGKVLAKLGYCRLSVRPRHPQTDEEAQEAFKKTLPQRSRRGSPTARKTNPSKSGSRTRLESVSKGRGPASGPSEQHGLVRHATNATSGLTFLAPCVRNAALRRRSS